MRVQVAGTGIQVFELAPPPVETKLMRAEFEAELGKRREWRSPLSRVRRSLESSVAVFEIRPGLANVLKLMSRIAPEFIFRQMTKAMQPVKV